MNHRTFIKSASVWVLTMVMVIMTSATVTAHGPIAAAAALDNAGKRTQFSLANLEGRYSFLNFTAGLAASMGSMTFDGNGNIVEGTGFGNTIALSGGQIVSATFSFTFNGTYTIEPNGTGHVTFLANLPGGLTQASNFDFVVLETDKADGKVVVTELRAIQVEREPNTHQVGQAIVKRLSDS